MGLDLTTYAMIVEELSRGWILKKNLGRPSTPASSAALPCDEGRPRRAEGYLPAEVATGRSARPFLLLKARNQLRRTGHEVDAAERDSETTRYSTDEIKKVTEQSRLPGIVFVLMEADTEGRSPPCKDDDLLHHRGGPRTEKQGAVAGPRGVPAEGRGDQLQGRRVPQELRTPNGCPVPGPTRILGGEERRRRARGSFQMIGARPGGQSQVDITRCAASASRGAALEGLALKFSTRAQDVRRAGCAKEQAITSFKLAEMAAKARGHETNHPQGRADEGRRPALTTSRPGSRRAASHARRQARKWWKTFRVQQRATGYSKEYEIEHLYGGAPLLLIGGAACEEVAEDRHRREAARRGTRSEAAVARATS